MTKLSNYIPINRGLFKHYLWEERRVYSKFEAWIDILQMASFTDNNSNIINGSLCKWNRGQYPVSVSFLEVRWGWASKKVRNFHSWLSAASFSAGLTTLIGPSIYTHRFEPTPRSIRILGLTGVW